jgi:hypothetical protein
LNPHWQHKPDLITDWFSHRATDAQCTHNNLEANKPSAHLGIGACVGYQILHRPRDRPIVPCRRASPTPAMALVVVMAPRLHLVDAVFLPRGAWLLPAHIKLQARRQSGPFIAQSTPPSSLLRLPSRPKRRHTFTKCVSNAPMSRSSRTDKLTFEKPFD